MFGIPINPTILFLYPFVSSPSLSLFSVYLLPWSFSPHVYPTSSLTENQFEQVRYNDISFGTRRRERRRAAFFSTFLCTAASHAVSTRVNFNSLSNDPRGSDLTDTRRPPLVRYKPAIQFSSIIRIYCAIRIAGKLYEEYLMYLM